MIRGFLSGVFWGGVVSALGLGTVSQFAPLPVERIVTDAETVRVEKPDPVVTVAEPAVDADTEAGKTAETAPKPEATPEPEPEPETGLAPAADQLDPPAGSEFAKPLPDEVPVLPQTDAAPAPAVSSDTALTPAGPETATVTDEPAAPPAPDAVPPVALAPPEDAPDPAVLPTTDDQAQIALADPTQPSPPAADTAPAPAEATVPPPAAEPGDALLTPVPDILPVPEADAAPDPDASPIPEAGADPAGLPQGDAALPSDAPLDPPTDDDTATLAPTPGLEGDVDGVQTGRLPRIGDAPEPVEGEEIAVIEPPAADAEAGLIIEDETELPPLQRYASPFENPDAKPVFAIILIDTGGDGLDRAALAALPFPVTFAIDPLAPEAAAASKIYRDAGKEVIMVATGIPAGATPADLEVTFQSHAAALPEAVAVIDTEFGAFQADRPLATQVVPILKAQGRGLISWDRGLNAADQVARREGLASAMVFRKLDGKAENKAAIRRALDRAAFKAAQDGRVAVIGQTLPETVAALLEWAVEGRAASVALAPVTAVLVTP